MNINYYKLASLIGLALLDINNNLIFKTEEKTFYIIGKDIKFPKDTLIEVNGLPIYGLDTYNQIIIKDFKILDNTSQKN